MYQLHQVCVRMVGGGVGCYRLVGKYIPTIIPYINQTRTTIPYKWFAHMNRWIQRQKDTHHAYENICMFWLNYKHAHSNKPQVYVKYYQHTWNMQCWFPTKISCYYIHDINTLYIYIYNIYESHIYIYIICIKTHMYMYIQYSNLI